MAYEGKLQITAGKLEELANSVKKLASEYQALFVNELYGTFENKMKTAYQGDDADAAITQLEGFRDDFEAMYTVINEYGKHLENALETYKQAQAKNTQDATNLPANRK